MTMFPGFMSVSEVAEMLGRSHAQVTRYIYQGLLKAEKQGNQWFIKSVEARKFTPPQRGNPAFRNKVEK